ncbi:MAG: hypothetical protein ACKOSS_04470 [Planctomycetia bacterium]
MSLERIATMPGPRRLAVAAFACAILAFSLLAQLNVATHVGEGSIPRPEQVLWRYHGKPGSTPLHRVLDMALPEDDPHAMWPYLAVGRGARGPQQRDPHVGGRRRAAHGLGRRGAGVHRRRDLRPVPRRRRH